MNVVETLYTIGNGFVLFSILTIADKRPFFA